jgi:hypothetical protein
MTPADLIREYNVLDDFVDAENKRFAEHLKPTRARMEEIKALLHGMMLDQKLNSMPTDNGTAYISVILTPKITDRDAYLKYIGDNWSKGGSDMLQLGAPQKDVLKDFMGEHDNQPPPGVEVTPFARVNIRRS